MRATTLTVTILALTIFLGAPSAVIGRSIPVTPTCSEGYPKKCTMRVPESASSCSAVIGSGVPSVTCSVSSGATAFGSNFLVTLPFGQGSGTCTILPAGTQTPTVLCPDGFGSGLGRGVGSNFGGLGKLPTRGTLVLGSTIIPATGSGTCTVRLGADGSSITATCQPGPLGFTPGTLLQFPSGSSRCTFSAQSGNEPLVACVGIPLSVDPPATPAGPVINGNTVIPPPGSGSCTVSRGSAGAPTASCKAGSPSFSPGTILDFPSGAGRCTFTAQEQGEPVVGCVGIPVSVEPPTAPVGPTINGNTVTPPPGSGSCTVSRGSAGAPPTATCEPGSPSFATGTVLEFPPSAGRCTYTAGPDGVPLIGCVGIPVTAPAPQTPKAPHKPHGP